MVPSVTVPSDNVTPSAYIAALYVDAPRSTAITAHTTPRSIADTNNRQPHATVLSVHPTDSPQTHTIRVILYTGATISVAHHPALLRDIHAGDSVVIHSIGSTTNEVHTHGTLVGIEVPAILLVTSHLLFSVTLRLRVVIK